MSAALSADAITALMWTMFGLGMALGAVALSCLRFLWRDMNALRGNLDVLRRKFELRFLALRQRVDAFERHYSRIDGRLLPGAPSLRLSGNVEMLEKFLPQAGGDAAPIRVPRSRFPQPAATGRGIIVSGGKSNRSKPSNLH
ncbi:MAG: hypothetical protein OD817_05950 [Gammaproteobacteria bacterium]